MTIIIYPVNCRMLHLERLVSKPNGFQFVRRNKTFNSSATIIFVCSAIWIVSPIPDRSPCLNPWRVITLHLYLILWGVCLNHAVPVNTRCDFQVCPHLMQRIKVIQRVTRSSWCLQRFIHHSFWTANKPPNRIKCSRLQRLKSRWENLSSSRSCFFPCPVTCCIRLNSPSISTHGILLSVYPPLSHLFGWNSYWFF